MQEVSTSAAGPGDTAGCVQASQMEDVGALELSDGGKVALP